MRPVSSASGMNSSGGMRPRPGGSSARGPRRRRSARVARSTIGWYWTTSWRSSIARSSSAFSPRRRTIESRMAGSKTAKRRLPPLLGGVHGDVGVAQQLSAPRGRCCDVAMPMLRLTLISSSPATTGRAKDRSCARRARPRRAPPPPGAGRGRRTRRRRGARRRRRCARSRQPVGDAAQQLVADGVAERVVDALEVVEVDEHHGDLARRARLERLAHLLAEQRAVGEPGQRVVLRLVLELFLQVAELGRRRARGGRTAGRCSRSRPASRTGRGRRP